MNLDELANRLRVNFVDPAVQRLGTRATGHLPKVECNSVPVNYITQMIFLRQRVSGKMKMKTITANTPETPARTLGLSGAESQEWQVAIG
jgi:hypothetical protein